jgi:hypothetical protein
MWNYHSAFSYKILGKENRKRMKAGERDKDDEETKRENLMRNCGGENEIDDESENHQSMKTGVSSLSGSERVGPQIVQYCVRDRKC